MPTKTTRSGLYEDAWGCQRDSPESVLMAVSHPGSFVKSRIGLKAKKMRDKTETTISQERFNEKMDALDAANPEPLRKLQKLRRTALMICMASDTGRITPRCSEPCPWCLNEAWMELDAESNAG